MPSVLFVCTANVCRSPLAMAFFRQQLQAIGQEREWRVESAGTWTRSGLPAAPVVQHVAQATNIDLSAHRSREVDRRLLHSFDLIVVMSRSQQEALAAEFPGVAERIHLLSELAGYGHDIPDPIEGVPRQVEETAREIRRLLTKGVERIIASANGAQPAGTLYPASSAATD